jgi:proteasome assembly chaperone 4
MRIAQRFGKQIFLSVDVPVSIGGDDSGGILVQVEKALVETLKGIVDNNYKCK